MRTIVHTVLIVLSIALLTCRKVYGQDEIFRFNEGTLSAIVDKIDEFDHTTPFLNARSPVLLPICLVTALHTAIFKKGSA